MVNEICPNYKELASVNYSVFMDSRNKATFIFPVCFEVIGSKAVQFAPFTRYSHVFDNLLLLFATVPEKPGARGNFIFFEPYLPRVNKKVEY